MSVLVPDLYGEVVGWLEGGLRGKVVCYLASMAGLRDDWGTAMSLAFSGGYEMRRCFCVWYRSGNESREYLLKALSRRKDVDFEVLLVECIKRGFIELVRWLTDMGFNCGRVLKLFSKHWHTKIVEVFLGVGIHADFFWWAVSNGNVEVIRMLLVSGVDVDTSDDVLQLASLNEHTEVVRVLLDVGADMHLYDNNAIIQAAESGHMEMMRILLGIGANLHTQDDYALRSAIYGGYIEMVRTLVYIAVDIHAHTAYAFQWAAKNGHIDIVRILMDDGINVNANNNLAIQWAVTDGHIEVVRILLGAGAKVHEYDDYILETVVFNGGSDIVRLMSVCKN